MEKPTQRVEENEVREYVLTKEQDNSSENDLNDGDFKIMLIKVLTDVR